MKILSMLSFCALFFVVSIDSADARRMGFGRSIGKMPPMKRQVTPPPSRAPQTVPKKVDQNKANVVGQNNSRSGFLGPLGGLAAGLGLAALANYMGFGEELMSFLLIVLGALGLFLLFRFAFSRHKAVLAGGYSPPSVEPFSPATKGSSESHRTRGSESYSPETSITQQAREEELAAFLKVAKEKFVELQRLWDDKNVEAINNFCSAEMGKILQDQLQQIGSKNSITSVLELNAELYSFESNEKSGSETYQEALIRFHGLVREEIEEEAKSFNEIWALRKYSESGEGWLLYGISQVE